MRMSEDEEEIWNKDPEQVVAAFCDYPRANG
jgi:hypothetical protein